MQGKSKSVSIFILLLVYYKGILMIFCCILSLTLLFANITHFLGVKLFSENLVC